MNCCDLEMPAVYEERMIKARKPHECSECAGAIRIRESYKTISGLWDGSWSNYKQCQDCLVIRCDIGKLYDDGCFCIPLGETIEELYSIAAYQESSIAKPLIGAFNAAAKERGGIIIRIKKWEERSEVK